MILRRVPNKTRSFRLALFFPLLLAGCGWTVTPPPPSGEPRIVYIAGYGRHSRLAVQTGHTHMTEYGYGDWRFYAEGDKSLWRGVVAIATPTQAALGKRNLPLIRDPEAFNLRTGADRSARLEIARDQVDSLASQLEDRYQRNIRTELRSHDSEFTYVRDDLPYHLFHNSNHRTAAWLQSLGCEISGNTIYSNFRVAGRNGSR